MLNLNHIYLGKATPCAQTIYSKAEETAAVFPLAKNAFAASKDFFPSQDLRSLNVAEFIMKQLTCSEVENFF